MTGSPATCSCCRPGCTTDGSHPSRWPTSSPRTGEAELDLTRLRGRSSLPVAVQAAEILLRRHLDLLDERPLRLVSHRRVSPRLGLVEFEHDDRRWRVHLDVSTSPPTRLTCRAAGEAAAPRFDLIAIDDNP